MTYSPVPIPAHLPERLTLTLWDFSWFVRTGPGEPFEDLDRAFAEAVERGYNTIRICAMPYLLFGSGLDTTALRLGSMGGEYAQRVRWYDVAAETTIDAREHLLELFRAAKRHNCFVIVSSWEYQQSPAFAALPDWYEALHAVDPEERAVELARAQSALVDVLTEHDLADRIAFVELHNEVQIGHLTEGLGMAGDEAVLALHDRLERGLRMFHDLQPEVPVTVNYAGVPVGEMRGVPHNADVLVVHPYVYGVLDALIETYGLRGPIEEYAQEAARRELLRPGAPDLTEWTAGEAWRMHAMIVSKPEIYTHDWCDPEAFDRWLYDHYGEHRLAMNSRLTLWLETAADQAAARQIPLVLGEGWVGYTPKDGRFEEGPVGAQICRQAMAESARVGAWGSIVCSNAAPQHSMWADADLQREANAIFTRA
ncbi:cellulase-like family protein [Ruania alba]|uniref:Sugar-binding cellulase-like n=1 Tax=Ruania alba TaxID=648782 RepID=A0A1H5NJB2_9MICO|nr:cellulase-like family protein [Ruania alba]SEF00951.1 Sugar-binding cellulase-like [Ruania alba]